MEGPKYDTRIEDPRFGLSDQAEALAESYQGKQRLTLRRHLLDLGVTPEVGEGPDDAVLDVGAGIDPADDEPLQGELFPSYFFVHTEWMAVGQRDVYALLPERLNFAAGRRRHSSYKGEV